MPIGSVTDVNPSKQDMCLPATVLNVLPSEDPLELYPSESTTYILKLNCFDEIKTMSTIVFTISELINDRV